MNKFSLKCQDLSSGPVEYKENIKKICEYIIKIFCRLPEKGINNNIRDNNIKFLNFWFNRELKKIITDKNDRSSVYSNFNTLCSKENDLNELSDKINEIDEEQYNKWSILYDLYDNYNKIMNECINKSNDLQNNCTQYSKKIVELFNRGIDLNNKKNDDEFNNSLKEFSILYNRFKQEKNFQKIIKLPKLKEVLLENTPAQNIYNKFYEENVDESLCIKYCGTLVPHNSYNNKDAKICAKIVTNLKKLPTKNDVGDTHEDRCSNLTFWAYDIIMNAYNNNKKDNIEKNVSSELNNIILRVNSELKKNENCIFYVDGSFLDWNEEKDLHDYFEHYNDLSKLTADKISDEIYCKYINYISNLYKKYMYMCCTCYSRPRYVCKEHCPKFFKCNKEYFPIDLLHKLECKDNVSLQKENESFESLIIDLDVIRKSQLMAMNFYKILTQDYFYRFIFSTFILLGIFLIFFLFYKFTPIGFKLSKKSSKKKQDNYHNNGGNRNELLEYEKKSINGNANKKRLRIAYHST
ncbi:hypothetical protein PVIIG_06147 [Plasmodium vivax India VII]|uniref:VIR protein n=1 Tax=Plasmodium vivax India VII TaxID=1077284 RepID=A0A0J9S2K8_PLAVI|nr:hypothetical protein PVIIG_06147 [Plasmodium vivax India VII]